ncbi:MAG: hypothetical protein LUD78_02220 [Clostridiales bacterium]|nr:hypothetical protein [Clostridiales bacterium]
MANAMDALAILHQSLMDTGCDEETTERCMALAKEHKEADIFPLLSAHRTSLLNAVHTNQRQIDCFKVYPMSRTNRFVYALL